MGYVQEIHHFVVCDLCGKRQEIREDELESDDFGHIIPPRDWARKLIRGEAAYMCFECQRKVDVVTYDVDGKTESLLKKNNWK